MNKGVWKICNKGRWRCFAGIWTSETNDLCYSIKVNTFSDDTVTIFVHNVISLWRYIDDIVSNDRIIDNDIKGFTETQIYPSGSTCKVTERLNFFNININNNENKF